MREDVALLTYGSRGDVEPFVALGVGLARAGHAVRLIGPAPYRNLVEDRGVSFFPLEGDPDRLARAFADTAGLSWPRMVASMIEYVRPLAAAVFRSALDATTGADIIVHSFLMTDAGHTIARLRGLPDVSAQLFPVFLPTSAFPSPAFPDLPLGPFYRRATHVVTTAVFRFGGRLLYRRIQAENPGLPNLAPWPFGPSRPLRPPVLFAYSPNVLPLPPDWPPGASVTGYWHLKPLEGWDPPADLRRFLEADPPPIYFGVGSMKTSRLSGLVQLVVRSLQMTGQRAVLGVPRDALDGLVEPDRVCCAEGVPHEWLFPRTRLVVHHGGAGTTGAAIRSGVPNTAVPFGADQAFWARRICELGLGPAAPPALRLTAEGLARVIDRALTDPSFRDRARTLGESVRQEDGVAAAVRIIEEQLASSGAAPRGGAAHP